jgi:hypothetical protein
VSEAERFLLDGRLDVEQRGRAANLREQLGLAALLQGGLEFGLRLEVLGDRVLAGRDDEDQPARARLRGFRGDQLDARGVHHR